MQCLGQVLNLINSGMQPVHPVHVHVDVNTEYMYIICHKIFYMASMPTNLSSSQLCTHVSKKNLGLIFWARLFKRRLMLI